MNARSEIRLKRWFVVSIKVSVARFLLCERRGKRSARVRSLRAFRRLGSRRSARRRRGRKVRGRKSRRIRSVLVTSRIKLENERRAAVRTSANGSMNPHSQGMSAAENVSTARDVTPVISEDVEIVIKGN